MGYKLIMILSVFLLLLSISSILIFNNNSNWEAEEMEEQEYHGPVPEGYDEEHFRKTGETILKEDKE